MIDSKNEWMTSDQAKERFGMTYRILKKLVAEDVVRMKSIFDGVNDCYLFSVEDVRKFINDLENARW